MKKELAEEFLVWLNTTEAGQKFVVEEMSSSLTTLILQQPPLATAWAIPLSPTWLRIRL